MKILLATDGSEYSRKAIEKCCELFANQEDTELKIISVAEPVRTLSADPFGISGNYYEVIQDDLERQATEFVARAEEIIRAKPECAKFHVSSKVFIGNVRQTIVEEAQKFGADLIVVGSHGYGFFGRMLLGSVSDFVLHHAPCSVLIVRDKSETP